VLIDYIFLPLIGSRKEKIRMMVLEDHGKEERKKVEKKIFYIFEGERKARLAEMII